MLSGTPISAMSQQQTPRNANAFLDVKRIVEVRIVDESLPADGRARLLEIRAHHDHQIWRQLVRRAPSDAAHSLRRHDVVNRAGTDDDEQSMVAAVEDVADLFARLVNVVADLVGAATLL